MNTIKYGLLALLGFFIPILPLIYTLTAVITLDFLLGIYKSYKLNQPITSRKMAQTLPKILLYNSTILVLYAIDVYVIHSGMGLEKSAAAMMIFIEMKSCDEHFKCLFGYSMWNGFLEALNRGKSITK